MTQDLDAQPQTLQELSRPEHLLVWALRAIAIGHEDCPLLCQTFNRTCGPMGWQALTAYGILVKTIGMTGRRRLCVHVPGCQCVGEDEKAIVGVVTAAQESLDRCDERRLRSLLQRLIEREPAESLVFAAQAVARILESSGLLPPRLRRHDDFASGGVAPLAMIH